MSYFFLELARFIIFILFGLYLPAKYFLKRLKLTLEFPVDLFFTLGTGLVLFTLLSYVLAWLQLDVLLIPLLVFINIIGIRNKLYFFKINKNHLKPLLLVLLLSLLFSSSMLITGIFGNTIIYRHDDPWHLALINELKVNFPPDNPSISGIPLKGYHFFLDFLLAKISNGFYIPPLSLHFHFIPLFIALLWGLGVYALMWRWSKSIFTSLWAVFLTMFAGGFAFVLDFFGHKGFSWDNGFGMNHPFGSLYNSPFAISIVVLLTGLLALYEYIQTRKPKWLIPLALTFGIISMFKVYAGMIALGGFLAYCLWEIIHKRFNIIYSLIVIAVIFLGTYWIFAGGSGYLIFFPFWAPHAVLQAFPWYGYDEKMYTYTTQGVMKGIIQTQIESFNIYILGNLGTRLIGLCLLPFIYLKKKKSPGIFAFVLYVMMFIAILIPMFFIQSGKVFEITQMTSYFLFFCSLFASFGFSYLFSLHYNFFLKLLLSLIIFILTIPSAYYGLRNLPHTIQTGKKSLSSPYFKALKFLSLQENYKSTVLQVPEDINPTEKDLHRWYKNSNPEITAFANKRSFLNNEFIEFPGVNKNPRFNVLKDILFLKLNSSPDIRQKAMKDLKSYHIRYIFSSFEITAFDMMPEIKKIYIDPPYIIYKVNY